MFKRGADICDIPTVTLSKSWGGMGLTRVIHDFPTWRQQNSICPCVVDLREMHDLRASEIMALVELLHPSRPKNIIGILAKQQLYTKLRGYQCHRLAALGTSAQDILTQVENYALQNTAVIFDCTRSNALLGPLRQNVNGIAEDELSLSPWLKGLQRLAKEGAKAGTVLLRPDQRGLMSSLRARAPRGLYLNFEIGQGTPISMAQSLYRSGMGWCRDALYVDAWTHVPAGLAKLLYHHRQSDFAVTEMKGGKADAPAALVLSESVMDELGFVTLPWINTRNLLQQTGQIHETQAEAVYDLARLKGVAQYLLGTRPAHHAQKMGRDTHMRGDNWIAPDCSIEGNCVIEKSIILPGVNVHKGAWISHQIVGPNWSVDYRFADKLPLNLRPADKTSAADTPPLAAIA